MVNEEGKFVLRTGYWNITNELLQPAVTGGFFWFVAVAVSVVILLTLIVWVARLVTSPSGLEKKARSRCKKRQNLRKPFQKLVIVANDMM